MTSFLVYGDNRRTLRSGAENSIDAVVTDPPYGLSKEPDMAEVLKHWLAGDDYVASGGGFMGKTWDSFVPGPATWREVYRVLKPGGYVVMFSGTRTWDMATLALRLAGFEIRDGLMWLYGSGFPKSMNVAQAIDKAARGVPQGGVDPTSVNHGKFKTQASEGVRGESDKGQGYGGGPGAFMAEMGERNERGYTGDAAQWDGWGTALKPAWEPIVLARKPIKGTVAANVLVYGTGALNIDASRIGYQGADDMASATPQGAVTAKVGALAGGTQNDRERTEFERPELKGRFPANVLLSHTEECVLTGTEQIGRSLRGPDYKETDNNVWEGRMDGSLMGGSKSLGETTEDREIWECVDDCPVKLVDEQSGLSKSKSGGMTTKALGRMNDDAWVAQDLPRTGHDDQGGASRFFYNGKVSKKERNAGMPEGMVNDHPTVKPIALMEYLIKLVTPPGGMVLDPFAGSGSTGVAAANLGFNFFGMDSDSHALAIARYRMNHVGAEVEALGKVEF